MAWRDEPHAPSEDGRDEARDDEPCPNLSHHGSDHRRAVGELATWRANLEIHALDAVETATSRHGPSRTSSSSVHPTSARVSSTLPVGGVDRQGPHTEDEIYCVIAGRALVSVGDEESPVAPGDVVFVGAGVPHRFHDDRGGAAPARRVRARGGQPCEGRDGRVRPAS